MKHAIVAVIRDGNRVLVIRRGPAAVLSGYWSPPSGRLEPGETQPETVVREMCEELGLEVRPIAKVWECPTDDKLYLLHWWSVEVTGGDLEPDPGEVSDVVWTTAEEFLCLRPTFEGDHQFFEKILPRLDRPTNTASAGRLLLPMAAAPAARCVPAVAQRARAEVKTLVGSGLLTHYFRPHSLPLRNLSNLSRLARASVLRELSEHEPLPLRLTRSDYFEKRQLVEARMRARLVEKGGHPRLTHPHYFVLGEFSLWETDGSKKVTVRIDEVPANVLSFTVTDSFFNYYAANLRGISVPPRRYHGELFTLQELAAELRRYSLPTEEWRTQAERRFEPYVEAQVWSDEPLAHLLL